MINLSSDLTQPIFGCHFNRPRLFRTWNFFLFFLAHHCWISELLIYLSVASWVQFFCKLMNIRVCVAFPKTSHPKLPLCNDGVIEFSVLTWKLSLSKQGPGCVSGTRARADTGVWWFGLLQFNARTSTKLYVLFQKWRQIQNVSSQPLHQPTSTSETIKTRVGSSFELGGGAGWPKGMSKLLFFFCAKWQNDRLSESLSAFGMFCLSGGVCFIMESGFCVFWQS